MLENKWSGTVMHVFHASWGQVNMADSRSGHACRRWQWWNILSPMGLSDASTTSGSTRTSSGWEELSSFFSLFLAFLSHPMTTLYRPWHPIIDISVVFCREIFISNMIVVTFFMWIPKMNGILQQTKSEEWEQNEATQWEFWMSHLQHTS